MLLAAWRAGDTARRAATEHSRALASSVWQSRALDALLDDVPLGEAVTAAERAAAALAVDYLTTPPAPMLTAALDARDAAVRELSRAPTSAQRRDLVRAAGHLSGVLAYAALDLGHPKAAAHHAATVLHCGNAVGDSALGAWVRGTQSLIARFARDYPTALSLAEAGLDEPVPGTATARLLAGRAQSAANLGDRATAHRALTAAEDAADHAGPDPLGDLFAFSRAKLAYYGASSLIWLNESADARRAVRNADTAIRLWQIGDPADRSLDDEALAHVYAATAHTQLGELDAAAAALAPVLVLPPERRISWLRRTVARVAEPLTAPRFSGSAAATDLRAEIERFAG